MNGDPWPCGAAERRNPKDHDAGVHAFKTIEDLKKAYENSVSSDAYGTVALAGNIVENETGYRAEAAYPLRVIVGNQSTARAIASAYGCHTVVGRTQENKRVLIEATH